MKTLWSVPFLFGTLGVMLSEGTLHAQNLGLEGGTGVFVTPLAYTVASPEDNVGKPVVGFHFVDADNVVGTFSKFSVTVGAFDRLEFGYTRDVHTTGDSPTLSPLWHDGFNIVHGKVNIVRENTGKRSWIPAISTGFVLRTQVQNVGGAITDEDTNNHDVYVVATKTITHIKRFPPSSSAEECAVRTHNSGGWPAMLKATRREPSVRRRSSSKVLSEALSC